MKNPYELSVGDFDYTCIVNSENVKDIIEHFRDEGHELKIERADYSCWIRRTDHKDVITDIEIILRDIGGVHLLGIYSLNHISEETFDFLVRLKKFVESNLFRTSATWTFQSFDKNLYVISSSFYAYTYVVIESKFIVNVVSKAIEGTEYLRSTIGAQKDLHLAPSKFFYAPAIEYWLDITLYTMIDSYFHNLYIANQMIVRGDAYNIAYKRNGKITFTPGKIKELITFINWDKIYTDIGVTENELSHLLEEQYEIRNSKSHRMGVKDFGGIEKIKSRFNTLRDLISRINYEIKESLCLGESVIAREDIP